MAHKNEKLLRDQDAAMAKGDMNAFWAAFADDVIGHIGGRSKLAGDTKGRAELQAKFGEFMAALGDNPELLTHDIMATDEHGIVLQSFRGTKKGKSFESRGIAIMHFNGGKISEAWFIDEDPYASDAFYDL
jgi:ketosteroid isomerase-like protein